MRESRNHLVVLALVLAVLGATYAVGYYNPIRYGLDLQGGLEVVLKATPNKGQQLTQEDLDKSIEIINDRVNQLGVSESEVRVQGADQIAIELPGVDDPEQAVGVVGSTAQLFFYKFQENLKGKAYRNAYELLNTNKGRTEKALEKSKAKLEKAQKQLDQASTPSEKAKAKAAVKKAQFDEKYYLFAPKAGRKARNPVAGPAASPSLLIDQAIASDKLKEGDLRASKDAASSGTTDGAKKKAGTDAGAANATETTASPTSKAPASAAGKPPEYTQENLPEGYEILSVPPGEIMVHGTPDGIPVTIDEGGIFDSQLGIWMLLRNKPCMSGSEIDVANAETGQGGWVASMDFSRKGGRQFGKCTEEIARKGALTGQNQSFAIVLDDEIKSAPYIDYKDNPTGIKGGFAQITGLDSRDEARNLALVLNTGSLPVRFEVVSKTQVSATLGKQELERSLLAGAIGLVIVMIYLLLFYRFLGLVADLALLAYAFIFYGLIVGIPITMTLPGIAGMILTIGVAADANIIIFERIREEFAAGRSVRASIGAGYRKGMSTIIDASVVTLITALVLFLIGTGSVRGFALLLGVGVLLSMFTAVAFTFAVLGLSGRVPLLRHPVMIGAKRNPRRFHIPWMKYRKWLYTITILTIVGSLALVSTKHLDLGVDFKSGTKFDVVFKQKPKDTEQIRNNVLARVDRQYSSATIQATSEPAVGRKKDVNKGRSFSIRVEKLQGKDPQRAEQDVRRALDRQYGVESFNVQTIGPSFGKQVVNSALLAIALSLALLVLYVWARFEWKFSIPVLIALAHDMIAAVGAYALFDREFKSATVAALLTILGYSLYDTIIVFDRIRENVGLLRKSSYARIVTTSLNEVLTRSINTSIVVIFPVAALFIAGGETLKDFAFALMIGIFVGAYSSLVVASPILVWLKEREPAWARRIQPEDGAMGKHRPVAAGSGAASANGSAVDGHNAAAEPADDPEPASSTTGPPAPSGSTRDRRSRASRKKR